MLMDFLIPSFCLPGPHLLVLLPFHPLYKLGIPPLSSLVSGNPDGAGAGEVMLYPAPLQWDPSPGPSAGEDSPHMQESLSDLLSATIPMYSVTTFQVPYRFKGATFVQVFKMKSACNLILLDKNSIYKSLFLLLSSLAFASHIYMYVCAFVYI